MDADGTGLRKLTHSPGTHNGPVFAPDGQSVFYLSGGPSAKRQIVRLPLDGGRPTPVTESPVGIESFVLSRDGSRVAFSAMVYPGPAGTDTLASTAKR